MTGSSADSEALAQPHPEAVTRMPLSLTRTACGAAKPQRTISSSSSSNLQVYTSGAGGGPGDPRGGGHGDRRQTRPEPLGYDRLAVGGNLTIIRLLDHGKETLSCPLPSTIQHQRDNIQSQHERAVTVIASQRHVSVMT